MQGIWTNWVPSAVQLPGGDYFVDAEWSSPCSSECMETLSAETAR